MAIEARGIQRSAGERLAIVECYAAMFMLGFMISLLGPSLPGLAERTGVTLPQAGFLFTLFSGGSIAATFFATAGAFAGLSLFGYTTQKDLSGFGSFLIMGVVGLIIASLLNIWLQSPALYFALSAICVLVFAGLTAYDTQQIKDNYYTIAGDSQMHDFRTIQDHDAPHTTSDLLFKGAVQDVARSVYTGLIKIREHARGTVAFQTNRNLTLSEGAWAESVPNLDIRTNDVKCSHASTVGPIDEDQRFYLESRGIRPEVAERLVVLGFFDEVLGQLPAAQAIPGLRDRVAAKLSIGEAP